MCPACGGQEQCRICEKSQPPPSLPPPPSQYVGVQRRKGNPQSKQYRRHNYAKKRNAFLKLLSDQKDLGKFLKLFFINFKSLLKYKQVVKKFPHYLPKNPFLKSQKVCRCYIFFNLPCCGNFAGGVYYTEVDFFFQNGARRIQSIRMIIMPASNNEASTRHFCEQSITNLQQSEIGNGFLKNCLNDFFAIIWINGKTAAALVRRK